MMTCVFDDFVHYDSKLFDIEVLEVVNGFWQPLKGLVKASLS